MSADVLTLDAPAKVNLHLAVAGRRPDGFHELVTVLQTIDLADTLQVALRDPRRDRPRPDVSLAVESEGGEAPADDSNLAAAAARRLLAVTGRTDVGVDIRLVKRIPAGGGLGGGSSDAAAALLAVDRLLGEPAGQGVRATIAAELGSDIPFFVVAGGLGGEAGGTALCTGRGEIVRPLQPPQPFALTLLLPPFGLSTGAVYAALAAPLREDTRRPEPAPELEAFAGADLATLRRLYRNDLAAAARAVEPRLAPLLDRDDVYLSGSGSTLFRLGPADDADELRDGLECGGELMRFVPCRSRNVSPAPF